MTKKILNLILGMVVLLSFMNCIDSKVNDSKISRKYLKTKLEVLDSLESAFLLKSKKCRNNKAFKNFYFGMDYPTFYELARNEVGPKNVGKDYEYRAGYRFSYRYLTKFENQVEFKFLSEFDEKELLREIKLSALTYPHNSLYYESIIEDFNNKYPKNDQVHIIRSSKEQKEHYPIEDYDIRWEDHYYFKCGTKIEISLTYVRKSKNKLIDSKFEISYSDIEWLNQNKQKEKKRFQQKKDQKTKKRESDLNDI
ncbi:hypothetical protein [Aquimarina sp. MMG016]|uniref:hypothetical protein n=1 Tax=Aquimarina sp. MMG016 TaxID=2822690 RepID=UPI001B3A6095|nr:hypothetical protein [Aquimarina sp. MMG016]MBQ4822454.1 hypothetical protein [Aquimarina sp. MMG016]